MKSTLPAGLSLIGLCPILLIACGEAEAPPAAPPPAVEYQAVQLQPITTRFEFVARTRALEDAEIIAQVSGAVVERAFDEGQQVEKGALLYRIDPRPYQAALSSAQASLSQATTSLDVAERNLARGIELEPNGYISDTELDKLRGTRDSAIAAKQQAEAALEKARIDLEFTEIRAPFTGTVGRSRVSTGDLVSPGGAVLLTIVQRDPMLVDFDVSERTLADRIAENQERTLQGLEPIRYMPKLQLSNGNTYAHTGFIDYAENRINASTGTITATARFPNPDGLLVPGQFARIILERGDSENGLVIPQSAVLEDMQGNYVYVVGGDSTVMRRNIALGQRDGVNWVVETGLEEGDRVIVNGIQKVRPGIEVTATPLGRAVEND
jgi:membrane fusion protein (multidrug efflux system)